MNLYPVFRGTSFYKAVNSVSSLPGLLLNEAGTIPVVIVFSDGTNPVAMDSWTVAVQIVGTPGIPQATTPPPAAAYSDSFAYDPQNFSFSGVLVLDTTNMATLIGALPSVQSVLEVRAVNQVTGEKFACQCAVTVLAKVISSAPSPVVLPDVFKVRGVGSCTVAKDQFSVVVPVADMLSTDFISLTATSDGVPVKKVAKSVGSFTLWLQGISVDADSSFDFVVFYL